MAIANITGNILTDSGVATSSLLPLSGGTLTDTLNGTVANFTSSVTGNYFIASPVATAAQSGGLRLNSQIAINARNAANSADITLITTNSSDGVAIRNGALNINSSGNVGIGTSSPDSKLRVEGGELRVTTSNSGVAMYQSGGGGEIASYNWGGSAYTNLNYVGLSHTFSISGTERGRFTSGGYFKARGSETSYYSASIPAHELRTGTGGEWNTIMTSTASDPYGLLIGLTPGLSNTGNEFIAAYVGNFSTLRFKVASNGGIYNFSGNNVNLSDISTKKDIIACESYWDKFKAIEIVKFKYIDQSHDDYNIGVIAQQVEEVAPEFIDTDNWNKQDEEPRILKAVYTEDLHHATIKVLQEAMAKIEELEAKVSALENK